jgi:histidine triad (HIT) family protein
MTGAQAIHFDNKCPFCRIIQRKDDARLVCEGPMSLAFFPLKPATLGHTLVIPKTHVRDLLALNDDLGHIMMSSVMAVARAVQQALNPDGMNVITSAGEAATQTVFHLHFHVVPRWKGDHVGEIWPPSTPWAESVKDDVADAVRKACIRLS